jgi:holo-[acyl-carrier protein] synthase
MIVGVGFDLFEATRLERELEASGGEFSAALFTEREIRQCGCGRRAARRLAACFAGKEAVAKALALDGSLGTPWRAVEVLERPGGRAEVRLHGVLAEAAARRGVRRIHLALAAARGRVAASAVLES